MDEATLISQTAKYVRAELNQAEGSHDWWHVYRVWQLSKKIAEDEPGDQLIIELGALLHDIADYKFHDGDETLGPQKARDWLTEQKADEAVIHGVEQIIRHISFKGGNQPQRYRSPELDVVQDADRLDAIGAIGIARAFSYGGQRGHALYDPNIAPNLQMDATTYRKSSSPAINHFYEKLLLLKDRMNTPTGRRMAEARHQFMEHYLQQFFAEWEGEH